MKKTITVFLILTLIAALLAGCGQTTSVADTAKDSAKPAAAATLAAPKENAGTPSAKEDHGTLKVSFPAGAVRVSTNILALELGYFDEEGVTVEPINLGGLDALTAINSNGDQLDILNTGFVNDIQSIGGGYDLTFIAGTAVEGGAVIAKKGEADKFKDADTIIDIEAVKNAPLDEQLVTLQNELERYHFKPEKLKKYSTQLSLSCTDKQKAYEICNEIILSNKLDRLHIWSSSHSMDIVVSTKASKTAVKQISEDVLVIGDRGDYEGNDFEMLSLPYSLSVDGVSRNPNSCWNLAPKDLRGLDVVKYYLRKIKATKNGFKIVL